MPFSNPRPLAQLRRRLAATMGHAATAATQPA
jgi:hypothetical protein